VARACTWPFILAMQTYILIQLLCQLIPTLGYRDDDYDENQYFLSLPSKGRQCSVAENLGTYTCNSKDYMKASELEVMDEGLDEAQGLDEALTYFDHRLGCFLEAVWGNVRNIKRWDDVYRMYVGVSESGSPDLDDTQLDPFVAKVGQLVREKTSDLRLQNGHLYGDPQLSKDVPLSPEQKQYLWIDFYHMWPLRPMPTGSVVATRMYIHASTPMNGLVIVEAIFDYCINNPDRHGVDELKIAGPGAVRDDNIVVYLTNPRKTMFLAETLARLDTSLFAPTLPPLVEPIRPGVGFADEPTIIEGVEGESFGSLYSKKIFHAIQIARQSSAKKGAKPIFRFLKEVWRELKVKLKLEPCNHASFILAASKKTQLAFANDAVISKTVAPRTLTTKVAAAVPLSG